MDGASYRPLMEHLSAENLTIIAVFKSTIGFKNGSASGAIRLG
ncbi:hypothetical protein [Avibacterium volantium]